MNNLEKILFFCEKQGFLKLLSNQLNGNRYSIGPIGAILQENLRNEWLHTNLINRDVMTFLNVSDSLENTYDYVKDICQDRTPFSIVQMKTGVAGNTGSSDIQDILKSEHLICETCTFISPTNSMHFFYNWQRQRRIWWRKFSASPGRYFLTDITSSENEQLVQIKSNFDWGSHILESVTLNSNSHPVLSKDQLQVKDGRRKVQAHCITSTTSLSTILINTLCDAYDEPKFLETTRPLLRFHRKIAPYKISFSISTSCSSHTEDLNDLALFVCKKLRTSNISVLYLPSASRNTLENQWTQYDELGIPYTILLNDNSLRNGIVHLRSRDTTLKEQVHISDLPIYVEQLFKNY